MATNREPVFEDHEDMFSASLPKTDSKKTPEPEKPRTATKYTFANPNQVHIASATGMQVIGARPPLSQYIKGIYNRRHFIKAESKAKAHGSIKGTALGKIWLILEPFLNASVYYIIFAVLLRFDRGMDNFVAYLVIGVSFFGYLSRNLGGAANIIPSGRNLIKAFSFPKASLVFSFALRNILDFLPTMFATILFIVIIPPHVIPSWTWLLFPIVFFTAIPFAIGLAFISATLTTLVKDLKFIWPLITRFWFYGSGVFWTIDMFDNPAYKTIMSSNPGWVFLELSRETLAWGNVPDIKMYLYFLAWSVSTFVIGFLIFWSQEERFGEVDN